MADPIGDRRFSDEEVRAILQRATEGSPGRVVRRRGGLSLDDLRAIGREVGIDPDRLEDAARAVVRTGADRPSRFLGVPRTLHLETTVPGTLDPADTPDLLAAIRRTMGHRGEVREVQGALEWGAETEFTDRHVTLSSRADVTTIRASSNLTNAALITYIPGGLLAFILSFIGLTGIARDGVTVGLILALVVVPVIYAVQRLIMRNVASAESDRLDDLADELADLLDPGEA